MGGLFAICKGFKKVDNPNLHLLIQKKKKKTKRRKLWNLDR